jgi:hypothetical protein
MIVDRYDPINLFERVPKLNLQFEPELTRLDELLDDEVLFCRMRSSQKVARSAPSFPRARWRTNSASVERLIFWQQMGDFTQLRTRGWPKRRE